MTAPLDGKDPGGLAGAGAAGRGATTEHPKEGSPSEAVPAVSSFPRLLGNGAGKGSAREVAADSVSVSSVDSVSGVEVVHAYTRAEALADGVLVDVTRQASPAEMHGGFVVPVAVTAALWAAIEAIPDRLAGIADARGRLHDVLWMASLACRRPAAASFAFFAVRTFAVLLPVRGSRKRVQTLRVEVGPDDHGAPCVTIGFPGDF